LKYFNHIVSVENGVGTAEPGVYYRDFEKETLKQNLLFASYPASRELCAIGGIVNNNSGGEKSLEFGKTEHFIKEVKVVLSDGNQYTLKPLNEKELDAKMAQKDFEGEMYRDMYKLITDNYDLLQKAKPQVSKNSAGYFLWNVYDKENERRGGQKSEYPRPGSRSGSIEPRGHAYSSGSAVTSPRSASRNPSDRPGARRIPTSTNASEFSFNLNG
jgi:FAD/FMN-containing dehydrogenase